MKIAILGAGAVGCYYGGMLSRAGQDVVLIGRARHVDAVNRDGLHLDTQAFQAHIRLAASTDAAAARGAALVLCCVKSADTEAAATALAPYLAPGVGVLSLQNGVDNADRLQAILKRPVVPAVVYVAAEMAGDGHVRHHGRGELVVGPGALAAECVAAFTDAGIPVQTSDNIAGALWAKLILNCAYNALSAITRTPYGELVRAEGIEAVMRDATDECLAVAHAEGVTLPEDLWDSILGIARTMPGQLSSTAQDLARGKKSEIDHLNGYIVRRGAALGIPTPVNRTLYALVRLLEERPAPSAAAPTD